MLRSVAVDRRCVTQTQAAWNRSKKPNRNRQCGEEIGDVLNHKPRAFEAFCQRFRGVTPIMAGLNIFVGPEKVEGRDAQVNSAAGCYQRPDVLEKCDVVF